MQQQQIRRQGSRLDLHYEKPPATVITNNMKSQSSSRWCWLLIVCCLAVSPGMGFTAKSQRSRQSHTANDECRRNMHTSVSFRFMRFGRRIFDDSSSSAVSLSSSSSFSSGPSGDNDHSNSNNNNHQRNNNNNNSNNNNHDPLRPDENKEMSRRRYRRQRGRSTQKSIYSRNQTTTSSSITVSEDVPPTPPPPSPREVQLLKRIQRVEQAFIAQAQDIKQLKKSIKSLTKAVEGLVKVADLLRAAGLNADDEDDEEEEDDDDDDEEEDEVYDEEEDEDETKSLESLPSSSSSSSTAVATAAADRDDYGDNESLFGKAPASVLDAADVAGSSILAAVLAGKQRLLVDVRDADLTSDVEILVQFVELAILPVAAGLEGLQDCTRRNRLKIVFPTVSQLLDYRQRMALAAPNVVALSTLGLDPIEPRDHLVVIVAPSPDDEQGVAAMNELLTPQQDDDQFGDDDASSHLKNTTRFFKKFDQPIVVLNPHMHPISGPAASYEVAYHLRLLKVQYVPSPSPFLPMNLPMRGNTAASSHLDKPQAQNETQCKSRMAGTNSSVLPQREQYCGEDLDDDDDVDEALAAAMKRAKEIGAKSSSLASPAAAAAISSIVTTRAMVIRAYPKPWHVFVDTSNTPMAAATLGLSPTHNDPKPNKRDKKKLSEKTGNVDVTRPPAEFEVAGTFATEPTLEQVHAAIVECLEGSEQEDEIVAQQMQQALENGQLDHVDELLGNIGLEMFDDDEDEDVDTKHKDEFEGFDDEFWDLFDEDSV